jgi:guanine deaminase
VSHAEWLCRAVRLATDSVEAGGGPFGALVVRADEIVASGRNRVREWRDPTAHAEIVAIREACARLDSHQLEGCVIYASSEPCPMCLGAIFWARPDAVYFANGRGEAAAAGFDDAFIYQQIEQSPATRHIPMHQVSISGAEEPFQMWRALPDREGY